MSMETTLFDLGQAPPAAADWPAVRRPRPAVAVSSTMVEARRASRQSAGKIRRMVIEFLRGRPAGATDQEIEQAFSRIPPSSLRGRRRELEVRGTVRDSGRRRPTATGRAAIVWILKEGA